MMNLGYPCICICVRNVNFRTCTKRYMNEALLTDIILHNLTSLENILHYNHEQGIQLFRISSDLIPFGSSELNTLPWRQMFKDTFLRLGNITRTYGMRVSLHPGQYTLLNALDPEIIKRSIDDLRYHCDILNDMQMDYTNKLVIHIGGVYGDKQLAIDRFVQVFQTLDEDIQKRLVIENDDRYYTLEDVLSISQKVQIPVIFDNLHHELHPSLVHLSEKECLKRVAQTWKPEDGRMKIHYSQQDVNRRKGAHAPYLRSDAFLAFYQQIDDPIDIMLEIKNKNIATLKALQLIGKQPFQWDAQWRYYKYLVLLHSKEAFYRLSTRPLLDTAITFYNEIDQALSIPVTTTSLIECFQIILQEWYERLSDKQRNDCHRALHRYTEGLLSEQGLMNCFKRVATTLLEDDEYLFCSV